MWNTQSFLYTKGKKINMGYVNLRYTPKDSDIVAEFYVEPKNGIKKIAEMVAAESSIGTWTDVTTSKPYLKRLAAVVFEIRKNIVKIAYPIELFEPDNIPQILSSVAGNILGMKGVKNLRLEDIRLSKEIIKKFRGPKFGIMGVRKILRVKDRPLLGTIIKPKLGLKSKDHAKVAYEALVGGCDFVKDDENLSNQKFNPFESRLAATLEVLDRAEEETGEKKAYLINITAETKEMIKRAELVKAQGGKYIMVDIITTGWASLQTIRNEDLGLAIHAHRAMHAAFTRNKKHGISMFVVAKLSRLIGVDQLHTGTIVGKLEGGKEIIDTDEEIRDSKITQHNLLLRQDWHHIKPVMPVCSGGLHPLHVPKLVKFFGKDIIIQMGGGIHGHPRGTRNGAKAARQAIEAVVSNIPLIKYAKKHKELEQAIQKWRAQTKYY